MFALLTWGRVPWVRTHIKCIELYAKMCAFYCMRLNKNKVSIEKKFVEVSYNHP